jgi:hypothetical protein
MTVIIMIIIVIINYYYDNDDDGNNDGDYYYFDIIHAFNRPFTPWYLLNCTMPFSLLPHGIY